MHLPVVEVTVWQQTDGPSLNLFYMLPPKINQIQESKTLRIILIVKGAKLKFLNSWNWNSIFGKTNKTIDIKCFPKFEETTKNLVLLNPRTSKQFRWNKDTYEPQVNSVSRLLLFPSFQWYVSMFNVFYWSFHV